MKITVFEILQAMIVAGLFAWGMYYRRLSKHSQKLLEDERDMRIRNNERIKRLYAEVEEKGSEIRRLSKTTPTIIKTNFEIYGYKGRVIVTQLFRKGTILTIDGLQYVITKVDTKGIIQ